jgi:GntR family transcriptional regulator, transcriptional repressor for pyruvate dehydrogenase complex
MEAHSYLGRPRAANLMVQEIVGTMARGGLKPGDRLGSEAELIRRYGYSRAVVREALRILERDGMITVKPGPNGGVFCNHPGVTDLTRSIDLYGVFHEVTIQDLTEARLELEVLSARLAAVRRTAEDLERLEALNKSWMDGVVTSLDEEAAARVNVDFHLAVAQAAHNPIFVAFMDALELLLYETALEPKYPFRRLEWVVYSHEYVLKPIREQDPSEAELQMRMHLERFRPQGWRDLPKTKVATAATNLDG